MCHSDTIADRYGIKLKRCSACLANRILDNLSHLIEVNVARHYLTKAVGNTDEGLIYIGISQSAGMKQTPVRRPLETFFNRVTSHNPASPKQSINTQKPKKAILTANQRQIKKNQLPLAGQNI
jgi:hypothetical protein